MESVYQVSNQKQWCEEISVTKHSELTADQSHIILLFIKFDAAVLFIPASPVVRLFGAFTDLMAGQI